MNVAISELLAKITKEHDSVVFNGNSCSEEWHAEAAKRGLPNLDPAPSTPLPALQRPEVVALFDEGTRC